MIKKWWKTGKPNRK